MKTSTTNGKEIIIPDMCAHCNLDSGGNHESHCPFSQDMNVYQSPVYAPCPDATWTMWCPHIGTEQCEECPVRKDRFNKILQESIIENKDILDALAKL